MIPEVFPAIKMKKKNHPKKTPTKQKASQINK